MYRLVIWGRTTDHGWQRHEVMISPTDRVDLLDKDGVCVVVELGEVPKPFDPARLSSDVIAVQGVAS